MALSSLKWFIWRNTRKYWKFLWFSFELMVTSLQCQYWERLGTWKIWKPWISDWIRFREMYWPRSWAVETYGTWICISNLITEKFPGELSRLVSLKFVDFSDNLIEGTWPLHVLSLHIVFFSISRNNLSGEIPSIICNLNLINYLDFSHNHFSMIPPCLGNMSDLINLDLQNNNLHGTIPKFVKCSNLRSLKLANNQLEGP